MKRKLLVLVLIIGLLFPAGVLAQSENPQSGSIKVEGTIEGEAPQTAPTISIPSNNAEVEDVPIDVSGLCTPDLLVRLFRNDIFTGSAVCKADGTWSITTDLAFGQNRLVAYQYDDLDQQSPASNLVKVIYDAEDVDKDYKRPFLTTDFAKLGSDPSTEFSWPFTLTGGVGPYALFIDWGDGSTDLKSLETSGSFDLNHAYENAGTYRVIIRIVDREGTTTILQLVAVARGVPTGDSPEAEVKERVVRETILWPWFIFFFFMVSTFWLGKHYEKHRLRKQYDNNEELDL